MCHRQHFGDSSLNLSKQIISYSKGRFHHLRPNLSPNVTHHNKVSATSLLSLITLVKHVYIVVHALVSVGALNVHL